MARTLLLAAPMGPAWLTGLAMICSNGGTAHAQTAPRTPEKIYARTCGYCHGHNVGPVIRGRKLPADAVSIIVRSGQGAMPAFRPTEISNEELKALARWISTSKADPKEHGQ